MQMTASSPIAAIAALTAVMIICNSPAFAEGSIIIRATSAVPDSVI
jgi:hypothetical protein